MAGFLTRLSKIFQAEANSAVSQLEDPIKLTEQGIRDLKSNLTEALQNLAQVKSVAIRMRKEASDAARQEADFERKAMALVQRAQAGELESSEADRLATEALRLKAEAQSRFAALNQSASEQENLVAQLQGRVEELRRDIGKYDNELITLRARAKTATSVKKINQHLAGADSSSTIAMLERMKEKVAEEEALAAAYGQLSEQPESLEDEINKALLPNTAAIPQLADSLAELKARMGVSNAEKAALPRDEPSA